MVSSSLQVVNADLGKEIKRLTKIYRDQAEQLERAYGKNDPVSWRKHPLSPLTPLFLSYLTTNLLQLSNGQSKAPKIIDLGCGAGEKTDKLRAFSVHVTGIDNINKPLRQARQLFKNKIVGSTMRFMRADLRDLPFKEGTFDGAHDYLAFLHIIKEDWPKYVRSVAKVLKKGAPLLMVTFSGNDLDFYGYPINKLKNRGIVFSDKYYQGDKEKVAHLIRSYFYFPKEREIRATFSRYFKIEEIVQVSHPLHRESKDHKNRKLWHILLKKR